MAGVVGSSPAAPSVPAASHLPTDTPQGYSVAAEWQRSERWISLRDGRGPVMTSSATTAVIEVSGVHWASSKAVTEAVLSRRPGVLAVDANPVSQPATVTYDPDRTSVTVLAGWVRDCGYHCAGQSVPDHVCDPMAEPSAPLTARIKIHG